jgi:hypothetical protein
MTQKEWIEKMVEWLEKSAKQLRRSASGCRFESLKIDYIADAKNFEKMAKDGREAMEKEKCGGAE